MASAYKKRKNTSIVDPSAIRKFTSNHYQQHLDKFQIGRPRENRVIFSGLKSIHHPIGNEFMFPGLYTHFEKIIDKEIIMYNLLNVGSTNSTAYNVRNTNKAYALKDRLSKAKGTALGTKTSNLYPAIKKAIDDGVDPKNIVFMYTRCHDARFVLDQEVLLTRQFKPVYNEGITKTP